MIQNTSMYFAQLRKKKAVIIVFLATKLISLADSLNIQKRAITSWQVLKMGEFSLIGIELL